MPRPLGRPGETHYAQLVAGVMRRHGWSLQRVALECRVSLKTARRWYYGEVDPSVLAWEKLNGLLRTEQDRAA